MWRLVAVILLSGCGAPILVASGPGRATVDVVIVPGCPAADDGTLSGCLKQRVLWAWYLYDQGVTSSFITSGAATHNRYSEAEAMAAGLHALGVPPERILLEENARHTDENMYYSLLLAYLVGWRTVAVASHGAHATGSCGFLESWQQPCLASPIDLDGVDAMAGDARFAAIHDVRIEPVPAEGWRRVDEWEEARRESGGPDRPSSLFLYAWAPVRRLFGSPWVPAPPESTTVVPYSERME